MRRRQGAVFVCAGAIHCAMMVVASLYSLGRFPSWDMSIDDWQNYYHIHFVTMFFLSASVILERAVKVPLYLAQVFLDFLAGAVLFKVLFWGIRNILARGAVTPWISLLPGLFLIYYGVNLHRGRQFWRRLELD